MFRLLARVTLLSMIATSLLFLTGCCDDDEDKPEKSQVSNTTASTSKNEVTGDNGAKETPLDPKTCDSGKIFTPPGGGEPVCAVKCKDGDILNPNNTCRPKDAPDETDAVAKCNELEGKAKEECLGNLND